MIIDEGYRRGLLLAAAFVVLLSLETSLAVVMGDLRLPMDLLLILTVFTGLNLGPMAGAMVGAGSGLLQELASGRLMSGLLVTKALIGYGAGLLHGQLNERYLLVPAVAVVGLTVGHDLVFMAGYLRQGWLTGMEDALILFQQRTLPAAGVHLLITLLTYGLFRRLLRPSGPAARQQEGSL